jgi:hypothetical protein
VNRIAERTVVLVGQSVSARQSLIAALQTALLRESLAFDFLCPAEPHGLADTPAKAIHLLWRLPDLPTSPPAHHAWRAQLHELQRPYQTLHADKENVLQQALFALVNGRQTGLARPPMDSRWQGVCECCADPECEQRLFGRLLQS